MGAQQLSFDDEIAVVGSIRTTRTRTERQTLEAALEVINAARRLARRLPNRLGADLRGALGAFDASAAETAWSADNGTDTATKARTYSIPRAGTGRFAVLLMLARIEPATDDDLETVLDMRHQTLSARRRELFLGNFIVADGIRLTRSGAEATLWKLTDKGIAALQAASGT